jgi:transposase
VNRIKAILARFGIRTFKPTLRKAVDKLDHLHTAEGILLPEHTRAELHRNFARLHLLYEQIHEIEHQRQRQLAVAVAAETGPNAMVRLLARWSGLSPDESGKRRRERGLGRAGNARVRYGMILLAWRFLQFQKDSALAQWFNARTSDGRSATRKTMIVALARKLLIALWRLATTGEVPQGFALRPAA